MTAVAERDVSGRFAPLPGSAMIDVGRNRAARLLAESAETGRGRPGGGAEIFLRSLRGLADEHGTAAALAGTAMWLLELIDDIGGAGDEDWDHGEGMCVPACDYDPFYGNSGRGG